MAEELATKTLKAIYIGIFELRDNPALYGTTAHGVYLEKLMDVYTAATELAEE